MKFKLSLIVLLTNAILFLPVFMIAATPAYAQGESPEPQVFKFLSAGIAFSLAALSAGWAISKAGSAGLAASAERPEIRTSAIIITALGEALAIYGIVVAILILGSE